MENNSYPGKFIVFEGLDGSGQTTQTKLLAEFLKSKNQKVLTTKEPTLDSAAGKTIREVLDEKKVISPKELQELYAEDRREHLNKVVIPALKKGEIVISDRYCFSSFAFGSLGVPLDYLFKINDKFLMPDLVFFMDTKPETCILRIEKRGKNKTLFEKKEKLEKVYKIYKEIFNKFKNVIMIDGEKNIEEIHQKIANELKI